MLNEHFVSIDSLMTVDAGIRQPFLWRLVNIGRDGQSSSRVIHLKSSLETTNNTETSCIDFYFLYTNLS